ncbi:trigger factor [Nitrogeniibacter mangrovi]|uniref:Trigger factor n=1 Tax=Nitrogeniibacter mangrovi TaxID=2016596 RepID=A0A6C1B2E0_9RHOO|nr:trigger factor [Nitrogeniibacter mangrovi]QID17806.1 trigger factor [Nitrogeniibacter mangrovi]
MQTNQETTNALERRIDLTISMETVEAQVQTRLKQLARTVKMPGFRPGKVPLKMVEQTHGGQARSEAIGAALEQAFGEKIQEEKLRVAGQPRIEPKEGTAEGAMEFTAVFEVYPEVTVGDLSDRQIERPTLEVSDAEVDKTIDVLRKQRTSYEAVEREAAADDRVVIDFTGRKDGEVFQGGEAKDFPFVLGAGSMLKDFEDAALGMKTGETKTFKMTFPEDYHASELAGQEVEFEITMKEVGAPKLPEVDEEFAKSLGVADGDVAKMREEVKANLEREVSRRLKARIKEQAMDALLEAHPIDVPQTLINREAEQMAANARRDMEQRGMQTKDLPISADWFTEQAVRRVKLGLVLAELVKAKDLYAKPEQVRALVEDFAQSYEDPKEVIDWYYTQPERLAQAEALVIEDNAVEWVLANAKTEDTSVDFDELMGSAA